MRMPRALTTLLVVLCGAMAGAGDVMANVSRVRRSPQTHHAHRVLTGEELESTAAWKRSHWREMQSILRHEPNESVECCPSVLEMIHPNGGKTPSGLYVDLYEDGDNKQHFYELSCQPDVVNKPCRFIDARLYNQSRCVQKYSYSYALVRYKPGTEPNERSKGHFSVPGSGGWSMDYIKVRAGCECEITHPKRKNGHRKRLERHRLRKKNKRLEELEDET